MIHPDPQNEKKMSCLELDTAQLAKQMRENVEVKDRTYHLKKYTKCFLGTEAVQWLVSSGQACGVDEAVSLGCLLCDEGHLFHVTRDHNFKNEKLFYRFHEDEESHGKSMVDDAGVNVSLWKKYSEYFSGGINFESPQNNISRIPSLPAQDLGINISDMNQLMENIPPMDEYNTHLLDNVHPSPWIQPGDRSIKERYYNLVVLGGGTAGLVSSIGSQSVGAKVALIESHFLGGDCTNFGCVPSKLLIKSAKVAKLMQKSSDFGIDVEGEVSVNFPKIMERMRKIRAEISDFEAAERLAKLGIDIYIGKGVFDSPNSILVDGFRLTFGKCIICTGGVALVPPLPGLNQVEYFTNESLFNLTILPPRFTVIGTGPIGTEMAQCFQRFGSNVTMIGRTNRILGKEDTEAANLVKESLKADGVNLVLGFITQQITKLETGEIEIRGTAENGDEVVMNTDVLLISTGRRPRVMDFGLEVANVEFNSTSGILVNDQMRTSNSNIYAAGDCCSRYQFTHMAEWMARISIKNSLFYGGDKFSSLIIPWCTFTDPEVAHVGLYEADLDARNIAYDTLRKDFSDNDRSRTEGEAVGFVKVHVERDSGVILGATIVGEAAGDMISEITLAMSKGLNIGALASVIHPYPTRADAIRNIGDEFNMNSMSTTTRKILRGIIGLSSGKWFGGRK